MKGKRVIYNWDYNYIFTIDMVLFIDADEIISKPFYFIILPVKYFHTVVRRKYLPRHYVINNQSALLFF